MKEKIFLGTVRNDYKTNSKNSVWGEKLYIEKHSWDWGWYWGFGHIGNIHLHTHFVPTFTPGEYNINKIFVKPHYTQDDWWKILDLMKQADSLKNAAEVYHSGGQMCGNKEIFGLITDKEMEKRINADLEKVLDKVWDILKNNKIK